MVYKKLKVERGLNPWFFLGEIFLTVIVSHFFVQCFAMLLLLLWQLLLEYLHIHTFSDHLHSYIVFGMANMACPDMEVCRFSCIIQS